MFIPAQQNKTPQRKHHYVIIHYRVFPAVTSQNVCWAKCLSTMKSLLWCHSNAVGTDLIWHLPNKSEVDGKDGWLSHTSAGTGRDWHTREMCSRSDLSSVRKENNKYSWRKRTCSSERLWKGTSRILMWREPPILIAKAHLVLFIKMFNVF